MALIQAQELVEWRHGEDAYQQFVQDEDMFRDGDAGPGDSFARQYFRESREGN